MTVVRGDLPVSRPPDPHGGSLTKRSCAATSTTARRRALHHAAAELESHRPDQSGGRQGRFRRESLIRAKLLARPKQANVGPREPLFRRQAAIAHQAVDPQVGDLDLQLAAPGVDTTGQADAPGGRPQWAPRSRPLTRPCGDAADPAEVQPTQRGGFGVAGLKRGPVRSAAGKEANLPAGARLRMSFSNTLDSAPQPGVKRTVQGPAICRAGSRRRPCRDLPFRRRQPVASLLPEAQPVSARPALRFPARRPARMPRGVIALTGKPRNTTNTEPFSGRRSGTVVRPSSPCRQQTASRIRPAAGSQSLARGPERETCNRPGRRSTTK